MSERTLVALRVVTDHLMSVGGSVTDVAITPELLTSASGARREYQRYLDSKKAQLSQQQRGEKQKAMLEEMEELKSKRQCFEKSRDALVWSADQLSEEAE